MDAPSAAEVVAARVSALGPVAVAGLNDAVTPWGIPDAARVTAPVKPFAGLILIVLVPEVPGTRLRLEGVAAMLKAAGAVIVRASLAVLLILPEVPVMVIVEVVAGAELVAISVSVLLVMALAGLNDPVTPAGNPDTVRFTALAKPCSAPTVMVLAPLAPAAMESVAADVDRLNPGEFVDPVKLLISGWPEGVPHPVARS